MHLYPRGNVMSEADTSADAQGGRGHRPVPSAEAFDRETSAELARRLHAMSTDSFAETAPNFLSATLENEADPTLENEATGSCCLVCRVLGLDAGQGVDPAVA